MPWSLNLPYLPTDYELRLPETYELTGTIATIAPLGVQTRSFDNRSRVFTLVGDETGYEIGYSTYRDARPKRGDVIVARALESANKDPRVRVHVSTITIMRRPFWRLF